MKEPERAHGIRGWSALPDPLVSLLPPPSRYNPLSRRGNGKAISHRENRNSRLHARASTYIDYFIYIYIFLFFFIYFSLFQERRKGELTWPVNHAILARLARPAASRNTLGRRAETRRLLDR